MNEKFVQDHGLKVERGRKVAVKLADGTRIFTDRFAYCYVDFGEIADHLYFTILPQCPLVLGMQFLRQHNPCIDFSTMSIMLGKRGTSCPPV